MADINKDDYIQSLENLLIFMCQTYEQNRKELMQLARKGNRAMFEISMIQGTSKVIAVARLSKMKFIEPRYEFGTISGEMERKRL